MGAERCNSYIIIYTCHKGKHMIRFAQQGLIKLCNSYQCNLSKSWRGVLSDMTVKSSEGNRCYIIFCELSWHSDCLAKCRQTHTLKHTAQSSMLQTLNSTFPESVQFCAHTTCFSEYLETADSAKSYMPYNAHLLWTKIECCTSHRTTPTTLHNISTILHRISWNSHCTATHSPVWH
jgi:hypothetical protein